MYYRQENTGVPDELLIKNCTIKEALLLAKSSILAFAIIESYKIDIKDIVGIIPGETPRFILKEAALEQIVKLDESQNNFIVKKINKENSSFEILNLEDAFKQLSSEKIEISFPFYKEILDERNYDNPQAKIVDGDFYKQYKKRQSALGHKAAEGLVGIYSVLQALMRHVSSKPA